MKITKKTKISEAINGKPEAIEILFEAGLTCVGCPMAQQETLEEGCLAHGMGENEIENRPELSTRSPGHY